MSYNLKYLPANNSGRDFVVGDLHGHYGILLAALDNVNFDKTCDRLFSVGDLVDRGPKSFECLSLLDEDNHSWFYAVKGNHEVMMCDALLRATSARSPEMRLWLSNGGAWHDNVPFTDLMYLVREADELPDAYLVDGRFGVCHTNPPSDFTNPDADYSPWARTRFKARDISNVLNAEYVYCGHNPTRNPLSLGNVLYLDTVATSGRLTLRQLS